MKTAKGWESGGSTPRLQEQFGYAYDAAWNLNRRTNNALVQTFGVNNLHPVRYRLDNPGNDIARRRAELRLLRQPMLSHGVNDGMLVVQERHFQPQVSTNIPINTISYTRGRDLSGSLQGAGGIGGLLARSEMAKRRPVGR
ncbi:MAG: hypothetical protein KIS67_28775 [Verrucomicrobiae bacterium]|nr:hypothetical protein [Verrucomicrobiae bacterium]